MRESKGKFSKVSERKCKKQDIHFLRKLVGYSLTITLLAGLSYPGNTMSVKAGQNKEDISEEAGTGEEKNYIILANDAQSYGQLSEEIEDYPVEAAEEKEILEDNYIMVASLSEEEAASLAMDNDVIIEEDFNLVANSLARQEAADDAVNQGDEWFDEMVAAEEAAEEEAQNEKTEVPWNLQAIDADGQQTRENSQAKVRVAVLDSGVDYSTGINLAGSVNLVDQEEGGELLAMFQDETGHGTAIASIISGNGETGVLGVNPNALVYSVKVLDSSNSAPLSRIIKGIYWCIDNDINIINMSFGTDHNSPALQKAVKDAYDANILMVAAAGNNASSVEYPAAFSQVMAVASTNTDAKISSFSNTGVELDLAAPGESVRVSNFLDGYTITHGTSIAVPHVVGAASILWEKDLSKSHEFIRQLLDYSAKNLTDGGDCGLLDVNQAISVYDSFDSNFDGTKVVREDRIPENTVEPESFAYISDNENYVEGRWLSDEHGSMVGSVATGNPSDYTFNTSQINIIKLGIQYPDRSAWKGSDNCPWWHGYGKKELTNGTVYKQNFIACYQLATDIALASGSPMSYSDYQKKYNTTVKVNGIGEINYNKMRADINTSTVGGKSWTEVLQGQGANNAENRKYFLFGCAMHILTDSFSHEIREYNGITTIKHDAGADDVNVLPNRHAAAMKALHYSLKRLAAGEAGNYKDYYFALKNAKYDKNGLNFKKRALYDYSVQNAGVIDDTDKIDTLKKASWGSTD